MIACRDDRNTGPQKVDGDFSSYSPAAGCVFAVHDDEIQSVFILQLGQPGNDRSAPRRTDNVAKKKNG